MEKLKQATACSLLLLSILALPGHVGARALLTTPGDGSRVLVVDDPMMAGSFGDDDAVSGLPADAQPHGATWIDARFAMVADFDRSRLHLVDGEMRSVVATIPTLFDRYNGTGSLAASPDGSVVIGFGRRDTLFRERIMVLRAPFDGPPEYLAPASGADAMATFQCQGIVFDVAGRAFVQGIGSITVIDPPYQAAAFQIRHPNDAVDVSGALLLSADQQVLLASNGFSRIDLYLAPFTPEQQPDATFTMDWSSGPGNVGAFAFLPGEDRLLVANGARPELAVVTGLLAGTPVVDELPMPASLDDVCGDSGTAGCSGFEHVAMDPAGAFALLTGNSVGESGRAPLARLLFDGEDIAIEALAVDSADPALRGRGAGAVVLAPVAGGEAVEPLFSDGFEVPGGLDPAPR